MNIVLNIILYFVLLPILVIDPILAVYYGIYRKSKWRAAWLVPGYGLFLYLKTKKVSK